MKILKEILMEIKQHRIQQHLSQLELASMAKVSLATLQNLEAGRGNPELKTILNLFSVLGLSIEVINRKPDWEKWISYGLPLISNKPHFIPVREKFVAEFLKLNPSPDFNDLDDRIKKAWVSFLCEVRDHYPRIFNRNKKLEVWVLSHQDKFLSPKLRRISLAALGAYL